MTNPKTEFPDLKSFIQISSVGDPDTKPDPHVFGHPGTGSISQRYGSASGSFPFSLKCVERTEIMPAK